MVIVEAPKIPAHIIAFGKLEILKNEKLIQNNLNLINENEEKMIFQFFNGTFQIMNRSNIMLINFKFSIFQEKLIFSLHNAGTFLIQVIYL